MAEHICLSCRGPVHEVHGKFGWFYGCNRYPSCKGTHPIVEDDPCPNCEGKLEKVVTPNAWFLKCPTCHTDFPHNRVHHSRRGDGDDEFAREMDDIYGFNMSSFGGND